MTVTIANAAGFLGDNKLAPRRTVESATIDYLTLEYLAELTLSILAHQRNKDSSCGFATDFVNVVGDLTDALQHQSQLRIISNGGGMNPLACARAISERLIKSELGKLRVGVVLGDDLLDRLVKLQNDGHEFSNLDTGEPLASLTQPIISANAYLGSEGIINALQQEARIVVTGRVADAALTIGPASFEHSWSEKDWNRLAGAAVAGHIIECGAQATGGYSVDWQQHDLTNIGYPIATVAADGSSVISKPLDTTGAVTRRTIIEQLVYEIGDPAHYLTPDVEVDFTSVSVDDLGSNRVAIGGAVGQAAPDQLKVSLAYHDGYMASAQLLVYGRDCMEKAEKTANLILGQVSQAGFDLQRTNIELLGANQSVPGDKRPVNPVEVMLRISAHDARRQAVQTFTEQIAPLITAGPAGLAGYATSRSRVRPVYAFWPTLIPRDLVANEVTVRSAEQWMKGSA